MKNTNIITGSFAGVNTGMGFVSFYDRLFPEDDFDGLYIIKGGSGTGKSTFMSRLADKAAEMGHNCIKYFCGSDESSLDGITVESKNGRKIGVIDGTPPHPKEFRSPGAAGDILNFGEFWNSEMLRAKRSEIDKTAGEKTSAFETAYRYLGAAEKINRHIKDLAYGMYMREKAISAAKRIIDSVGVSGGIEYFQLSGYTMHGNAHLSPDEKSALYYTVSGDRDIGEIFLTDAADIVKSKGVHAVICRSPLNLTSVEEIYFPESNVWISAHAPKSENIEKTINTRRFTDREEYSTCRQRLRFGRKCREALIGGAAEAFSRAGEFHFKLEEIYKKHMNFDALAKRSEIWCCDILSRLD